MITAASADALPFADGVADACLTSPPYWGGLRVYDGPQARDWPAIGYPPMPGLSPVEVPAQTVALGHESDPFAFVGHLLQVFREVRRVLVPGGCLAVNLGDCYSSSPSGQNGQGEKGSTLTKPTKRGLLGSSTGRQNRSSCGLASKNLVLMPWRFALAMQADGWILRSRMPGGVEVLPGLDVGIEPDIVWRKPSCMPESVRDRPTVDFEDVLIFSQEPRYFWDQEAGREKHSQDRGPHQHGTRGRQGYNSAAGGGQDHSGGVGRHPSGRNMRSAWAISPEPTSEEHFAAWPTALAARLIRVMTSERGRCPECGAPWVRQVERTPGIVPERRHGKELSESEAGRRVVPRSQALRYADRRRSMNGQDVVLVITETGWAPSCAHDVAPSPCVVLDPFAGLGRTWEAATQTGRRFLGAELAPAYAYLARSRNDLEAAARRRSASGRPRTITGPLFEL